MQTNPENIRGLRSKQVLWKWTGVSAVGHVVLVGALCGVSYLGFAKREAASKAKIATEEAAARKAEADEAAKASSAAAVVNPGAGVGTPAIPFLDPAAPASPPVRAEKILGIDETAKPENTPKSPFANTADDLLKDLK